jgi:hypothetical protein
MGFTYYLYDLLQKILRFFFPNDSGDFSRPAAAPLTCIQHTGVNGKHYFFLVGDSIVFIKKKKDFVLCE